MESTLLNIILQKHLTYGFYISVTSSDFIFLAKNEKDIYFFNYETGNLKSVREMSVSEFKKLMGTRNR
jgi:hypothetical protein